MKKQLLLNWMSCAMIFGWTSKSYCYDYVVLNANYQYWSTQECERDYPAPGKMVDIGGFKLHTNCTGKAEEKQSTVVLETGLGKQPKTVKLTNSRHVFVERSFHD